MNDPTWLSILPPVLAIATRQVDLVMTRITTLLAGYFGARSRRRLTT